jgi:hypothetical protein
MTTRIWYKNLRPELQDVGQRFNKARAAFVIINRCFKQLVTRLGLERASALAAAARCALLEQDARISRMLGEIDRLTAERDAARAEAANLRQAQRGGRP